MRLHGTAMPAGGDLAHDAASPAGPREAPSGDARHGDGGSLAGEIPARADRGPAVGAGLPPGGQRARLDRPARWLTASMVSLGILAAAAAVVSYSAQYQMVLAAKAVAPVAALEAGIPDVAALIFATLGIALALHGKRAIRARALNVGAVATSITMNVLAAGHGWRDLAEPSGLSRGEASFGQVDGGFRRVGL